MVGASVAALPRYEAFVAKSKIQEGFTLASDTRTKLSEFYITRGRFPKNAQEAGSIETQSLTPPEFVRDIQLDYEHPEHDVFIRIYFKEGVLTKDNDPDDFVYIAGNPSSTPGSLMEWTCGGMGIHRDLLPAQCTR